MSEQDTYGNNTTPSTARAREGPLTASTSLHPLPHFFPLVILSLVGPR